MLNLESLWENVKSRKSMRKCLTMLSVRQNIQRSRSSCFTIKEYVSAAWPMLNLASLWGNV